MQKVLLLAYRTAGQQIQMMHWLRPYWTNINHGKAGLMDLNLVKKQKLLKALASATVERLWRVHY